MNGSAFFATARRAASPPKVLDVHRDWLLVRMEAPFTLRGLVIELAAARGVVDYRTVWNFVHAQGLSFKKKRAAQRAGSR